MNPQNQKLEVALYLRGDNLDPAQASRLLGLEPTKSQRKREERLTSTNRKVVAKVGLWALVAESKSDDLSVLIDELASKLGDRAALLPSVPGVQEAFLDVFIAIDADPDGGGTCEFQLSAEDLHSLKQVGVATRFTVAVVQS